jgi:glycosyltransferase involved in cell wall biosynthesis
MIPAVKYTGTAHDYSGYGDANRAFINSLFFAGVDVTVELVTQTPQTTDFGILGKVCDMLVDRDIPYKAKVIHLTPDLYPRYVEKKIYNIGHLFWETDKLPEEWIKPCNLMDEIWTASEPMERMLKQSGIKVPIFSFPEPIYTQKLNEKVIPFETQYKKDFTFYSIFQWIDRKNPRGLLRAYWKAFENNDQVTLLLRTYRINHTEDEYALIKSEINSWKSELRLRHYPKIFLVKKLLTYDEMAKLHKMGNCYVNASSGEGWCRPLQEAMLYGQPAISGNNGGITDYMTSYYYYEIPSAIQGVTQRTWIPWYTPDQNWKVVDETKLSEAMRKVYDNYDEAKIVGRRAQDFVLENFSLQTVGSKMKERLAEIYRTL